MFTDWGIEFELPLIMFMGVISCEHPSQKHHSAEISMSLYSSSDHAHEPWVLWVFFPWGKGTVIIISLPVVPFDFDYRFFSNLTFFPIFENVGDDAYGSGDNQKVTCWWRFLSIVRCHFLMNSAPEIAWYCDTGRRTSGPSTREKTSRTNFLKLSRSEQKKK